MYYRRKIILQFLSALGGAVERLRLQKLLFLFSQQQQQPVYHFLPYKYGAYSFQANADLGTLAKYGWVTATANTWQLAQQPGEKEALKAKDATLLQQVVEAFGHYTTEELLQYTYTQYPYYALKSQVWENYLTQEAWEQAHAAITYRQQPQLFTIGYEGKSLETYINELIRHNIKALCDVRKNAFSMKYGFSKKQLRTACEGVGINYVHLPELGIPSALRQHLAAQSDYDQLFVQYKKEVLPVKTTAQESIITLLREKGNVALTCFEANSCQCHRRPLAEHIQAFPQFTYTLQHL